MNVPRLRRPGRVARRVIAGTVVVAVVGGGYAAYSASADGASYRTAAATVSDVEQTLVLSGTVEPAGRADLAFATSGTLAEVGVRPGQKVKAGAVLGTLDDASLRKQVQQARSTLASARAQLESDQDAQADAVSESSSASSGTGDTPSGGQQTSPAAEPSAEPSADSSAGPSGTPTDDQPTGGSAAALAALKAQQKAVTDAQSVVSAALTTARDALAAQQTACENAFAVDPGPTDPTADPSTDPSAAPTTPDAAADADQACTDALTAVQTAQQQVSDDQDVLQQALTELTGTLTSAITALGSEASTAVPSDTPDTGSTTSNGSDGSGNGSSAGTGATATAETSDTGGSAPTGGSSGSLSVTAATLANDQARIDQARADLVTARQQLAMATVTAPFSGQVVEVEAEKGDSVSSGTTVFVLISRGATTVELSATSTQVEQLAVGQAATVTPAGSDRALAGTVTQVSNIPADSSYPVTITLDRKNLNLATGLNASVSVVTATAEDVVTVPASAVSNGVVQVVEAGTATRSRVTTGVRGATTVEIVDGVEAGDELVLADLDAALPTTEEDETGFPGGGAGFTGGFPGGGSPPAGFPAGGQMPGR